MDYSMESDNRRRCQDMEMPQNVEFPQDMEMPQDMRAPQDMGMPRNMGMSRNMGMPQDIGAPQDMGMSRNMGMPQDMRAPQDTRMPQSMGRYICGNYYCMAHVIRPGDTLYKLSREYGVKVSALMMANPFVDIYNLRIGDELCIPRLRPREEITSMSAPQNSYEEQRVVDAEMNMQEGINADVKGNTY